MMFPHIYSKTLFNQLLFSYVLVIAFALAVVTFWALFTVKSESIRDLRNSLEVEAVHLALEIDNDLAYDSEQATKRIQQAVDRHATRLIASANNSLSITVVNKTGHVLADSGDNAPKEGKNLSNEPEINDALSGIMAFYRRNEATRRSEWLYVAYPVRSSAETLGVIRVGVPLTDINQRVNRDLIVFLQIIAATLVTTVLISLWLAKRITQPIKEVSVLSQQISQSGDITSLVPVKRHDEIGEMISSFNQMIGRLQEEEKIKQEFIANASHELKTPTMAIGSVVEALQAGAAEEPELRKQFLNSLEKLVDRQSSLLHDLLDIAQLDVTAKVKWQEDINLNNALHDVIEQIKPQAQKKQIALETDLENTNNCLVIGNNIQLQRAFINFLTNAVSYTTTQGCVKLSTKINEDNQVEIKIEDTGSGIDATDLPHIFERFYRTDKARSRASGGTGLGLAISKEIINRHRGTISVESIPGQGSIFTIVLPLKETA